MPLWVQVLVCTLLVVIVGSGLSRSADIVAEKTGLGASWVGGILLAGATSLPELATGLSAIALNLPDLAVGGILGSCLFNLFILALLDFCSGPAPVFRQAGSSHSFAASLGVILLGVSAAGMSLAQMGMPLTLGWVGVPSVLLLLIYLASTRRIMQFEQQRRQEVLEREAVVFQYANIQPRRAYLTFGLLAVAIFGLGIWLASLGDRVAETTGLSQSFVGALLLAAATSMPELVTTLAAIRLRAVDLAVSNLFGSNIFNLAILGIYDLAYGRGNLWSSMDPVHLFTAVVAIVMTGVAIAGLIYRATRRSRLYLTWDGLSLIALYIGGMYVIFRSA